MQKHEYRPGLTCIQKGSSYKETSFRPKYIEYETISPSTFLVGTTTKCKARISTTGEIVDVPINRLEIKVGVNECV